jgi:hypothetical protein
MCVLVRETFVGEASKTVDDAIFSLGGRSGFSASARSRGREGLELASVMPQVLTSEPRFRNTLQSTIDLLRCARRPRDGARIVFKSAQKRVSQYQGHPIS